MMELKQFQEDAVTSLVKRYNQQKDGSRDNYIVFKSPTGSGKTIMMGEFLRRIITNNDDGNTCFIWVAPRDLHNQSKAKIGRYLKDYAYSVLDKDSLTAAPFAPNDLFFFNWEGGIKKKDGVWDNILVRENETEVNLQDIMGKTRDDNRNVVIIVDESHHGFYAPRTQEFIDEIIHPNTVIMVSATPKGMPEGANSMNKVDVKFEDVVASGLIKKDVIINAGLENVTSNTTTDAILEASLSKQKELKKLNPVANPLVLVQLPNEKDKMSELDTTVKESVEQYLRERDITYDNGKLGVWLSGEKKNLDSISDFNSDVQVLIFKQAIALGWDCPRASVMAMFRENKSEAFQIQTVGRVMRMPEAKHYADDRLNSAYVYTALDQISISGDSESEKGYFNYHTMRITDIARNNNVSLPSVYLNRTDFHDFTSEHFKPILARRLLEYFDIDGTEMQDEARRKIENKLKVADADLQQGIVVNVIIKNLEEYDGTTSDVEQIKKGASHGEIEYVFEQAVRSWCLPYGVERSKAKIKNALYKVFNMGGITEKEVKRLIVCSTDNYDEMHNIVQKAKDEYEPIRKEVDGNKRERTENVFSVPTSDEVNESYERGNFTKYALTPCYVKYDSTQEREFAAHVDGLDSVVWWYKNGAKYGKYLGISYMDNDGNEQVFYPDFIIKTTEKVWVVDTKSGFTLNEAIDNGKAKGLDKWLKVNHCSGGIITKTIVWEVYDCVSEDWVELKI